MRVILIIAAWLLLAAPAGAQGAYCVPGGYAYCAGEANPASNGPSGVTINDGAIFTNTPQVTVSVTFPQVAGFLRTDSVQVSNDGGFGQAQRLPLSPFGYRLPWTLQTSGFERLPKTVYVRLCAGSGASYGCILTMHDDIILDQTPPVIERATATGPVPRAGAIAKAGNVKLRVAASDATSGVAAVQAGSRKSAAIPPVPYLPVLTVAAAKKIVYVRVFDLAGNVSNWRTVKVKTKKPKKAHEPKKHKKHRRKKA